jgi:hypothetical protein
MKTITQKILLFVAASVLALSAQAAPLAQKEWTFLLFLNGHNNLSSFGSMNLKDMEKSGSTDQVNLVVEWGQSDTNLTHRLLVQKSTDPSKVTSPIIESLTDRDMGDYHSLVDFVKWGATNFPAKHYFVAVWNHGAGWHIQEMKANGDMHPNDISYDDNSGNHITTEQLGTAMGEIKQFLGRNVDIYGSDACLMQMLEVAGQMKNSVDYFVGSEETEPGEGWPYAPFIQKWTANAAQTPAEVSVLLSKEYLKAYSAGGVYGTQSITFSALDLSKLDAVFQSAAKVVANMKALSAASLKKIKTALRSVQSYYYSDYKDYGHFLKTVGGLSIESDANLITQAKSDLSALVLSVDSSASFANSTGVSVWIPSSATSSYMSRYKGLEFDKTTGWSGFLEKALQ